jgi:hypothetical protein
MLNVINILDVMIINNIIIIKSSSTVAIVIVRIDVLYHLERSPSPGSSWWRQHHLDLLRVCISAVQVAVAGATAVDSTVNVAVKMRRPYSGGDSCFIYRFVIFTAFH